MPHTPGKWTAEHRPSRCPEDCGAVVVDSDGNELFDSYNRHHKRSLIEQPDSDGRWFDTAGYADLELAAQAPDLLAQTQRDAAVIAELQKALRTIATVEQYAEGSFPVMAGELREIARAALAAAESRAEAGRGIKREAAGPEVQDGR